MAVMFGATALLLQKGDITKIAADAIVNAANPQLKGGGGVDSAIHRAGGRAIAHECRRLIESIGRLAPGKAVITTGGSLPAKHVIHTVGPVWTKDPRKAPRLLADAYRNSLQLADKMAMQTIAFPSISTGAYGYPLPEAAKVALEAVRKYLTDEATGLRQVQFILYSDEALAVYQEALTGLTGPADQDREIP